MADGLPRRHTWRIDNINNAPDAETALRRMFEFARAEAAKCEENRPADADEFRWQMIHLLAPVVAVMYKSHPMPVPHELSGGGWLPHRARQRAAEARHP